MKDEKERQKRYPFQLIPTESDLTELILIQISRLTGLPRTTLNLQELGVYFQAEREFSALIASGIPMIVLMDNPHVLLLFSLLEKLEKHFLGISFFDLNDSSDEVKRSYSEKRHSLMILIESLFKKDIVQSYGLSIPSYIKGLTELGIQGDKTRHLLIGSLSIDSVVHFKALLERYFGESSSFTIDIDSHSLAKPGLIIADGTRPPFASEIFDSVHTNYLLHKLVNNGGHIGLSHEQIKLMQALFNATYRLLKPGGGLIMVEGNILPNDDMGKSHIINLMHSLLISAGFNDIGFSSAKKFVSNRELYRYMLGQTEIMDDMMREGEHELLITAKKVKG